VLLALTNSTLGQRSQHPAGFQSGIHHRQLPAPTSVAFRAPAVTNGQFNLAGGTTDRIVLRQTLTTASPATAAVETVRRWYRRRLP